MSSKTTVPSSKRLLQPIQRLVKSADVVWMRWVLKTRWLNTVDSLGKSPVEESILDVQLMNRPMPRESQGQHCTNNSSWLNHRTESVGVVDARTLSETPENLASFITLQRTVSLEFVLKIHLPDTTLA